MRMNPDQKATNYQEIAHILRQLAEKLHARHQGREKLLSLADQFDQFATNVGEPTVQ